METSEDIPRKPAYKPRRSTKPPGIKAAIVAKRMQNISKRQIAKELDISRTTVTCVLEEANLDQQIESGRIAIGGLIPKAIDVVNKRLDKTSETAAFKVLEGIGVLRTKSDVQINIAAVTSSSWYQRRTGETKQIEAEIVEKSDI